MAPVACGRGRIEIHHGPPSFFDDHFESGWTGSGGSSDGELYTLNNASVEKSITSFSTDTYTKIYARLSYLTGSGTWDILLWDGSGWNVVLSSDGYTGFKSATLPSGKNITKIKIACDAGLTAKFDYISIVKGLVVPLDPPTTQDIWGAVTVTPRMNKNSTAEFVLNNIPSTFGGVGPYTGLVDSKDVVIVWMFRDGDTMTEAHKQFGGVITKLGDRAEKTAYFLLPVECMDHGWELQKPPSLFNSKYSTATNGKTIIKAAIDLCSYLDSALVDDASEIASTHTCDYSSPGAEVIPWTILNEFAPKCQTAGGAVGFDWRITPSGVVDLFPRDSISSGITLDDDDLESFARETDWWQCWNDVTVYGAPLKRFPLVADTWTEGNGNYNITSGTEYSHNSTSYSWVGSVVYTPAASYRKGRVKQIKFDKKIDAGGNGLYKVTYQVQGGSETVIVTDVAFTNSTYDTVTLTSDIMGGMDKTVTIRVYMATDNNTYYVWCQGRWLQADEFRADWRKNTDEVLSITSVAGDYLTGSNSVRVDIASATYCAAALYLPSPYVSGEEYPILSFWIKRKGANFTGEGAVYIYDSSLNLLTKKFDASVDEAWTDQEFALGEKHYGEWSQQTGTGFDWLHIYCVIITLWFDTTRTGAFCLDFFNFGGKRYSGSANNSASQALWGVLKRPPETDDSLLPDAECTLKAQGILATCLSPVVSVGPLKLLEGQKIGVGETVIFQCTTPSISSTLRIVEVELVLEGTELESSYKLSNEPIEIDYLFKLAYERIKLAERAGVRT